MILRPPPKPSKTGFAYAGETFHRLPLAEAFYSIWAFLADVATLDALFAQYRGRCYEDTLTFTDLVTLFAEALTRHHGSGAAAIAAALKRRHLPTQARAVYAKLSRVPLPLAEALLATLTARLRQLTPDRLRRNDLPKCLDAWTVVVLDGKKIKKVAKRLLATRGRPGKLYGGHLVAAYLPADGLVPAMAADPDGEANDRRLMPRVLPLVRAAVPGPRVWVADSQFCDLKQPAAFAQDDDHFLLRFTARNHFTVDSTRSAQAGVSATGQAFVEDWGWMGAATNPRRRYLRRITLARPGEPAVVLVTDLPDATAYPAADLLAVYLLRWQIENVYQQITEVFGLKQLIGCTPQATVFQAALCLVIYNVVQVIRGYVAQGQAKPVAVAGVSSEQVFKDVHEQLVSVHTVLTVEEVMAGLHGVPHRADEVRALLQRRLQGVWSDRWRKAAVPANRRPAKPKAQGKGAHTSVHKLLEQAKRKKREKRTPLLNR